MKRSFGRVLTLLVMTLMLCSLLPLSANPTAVVAESADATLATPVLVSPANGLALFNYPRVTTLAWRPVAGATYYIVEKAYYSSGWVYYPSVQINGNSNTTHTFTFIGDQAGAWRVTAHNATMTSAASAWWQFTYSTKPRLATPVLVAPANNVMLYNYPRTTTLHWRPVPGASGYRVEVQYYDASGPVWKPHTLVNITGVANTSYTINFVGDQPGRWRIIALGTAQYYSSYASAWWQFNYRTKPTLAIPVVVSPANGTIFDNYPRTTTLSWKPSPGADGYQVEIQYYSGGNWYAYNTVTVNGVLNSYLTTSFVGAQPGRWRVRALSSSSFYPSPFSAYVVFTYTR